MSDQYVSGTSGNDTTGSGTSGSPWKTIQKGVDSVTAYPDVVYVKIDSSYNYAERVTFISGNTVAGTDYWQHLAVVGYHTTIGDCDPDGAQAGGQILMDGTSGTVDVGFGDGSLASPIHWSFANIHVTGTSTGSGFNFPVSQSLGFVNCRSSSSAAHGFNVQRYTNFWNCVADANTTSGFFGSIANSMYFCKAYDNMGGHQIDVDSPIFIGNLVYGLASTYHGIFSLTNTPESLVLAYNTVDGENTGADLVNIYNDVFHVFNNILFNGLVGFTNTTSANGTNKQMQILSNNLANANDTLNYEFSSSYAGHVGTDPAFTAEGSDYTLGASSPALAAGKDLGSSADIGAYQRAASGTTLVMLPNRTNSLLQR